MDSSAARPTLSIKTSFICFVLFFLFYVVTGSGHFYVGDEVTRYNVTRSMWERGRVDIDWGYGKVGRDGRLYSKYGVLQSVLALPLYVVGKQVSAAAPARMRESVQALFVTMLNAIATALTCVLMMWFAAGRLGMGMRGAVFTAVVYGLFTMAWNYARTFFTEPLLCLLLMGQVLIVTGGAFRSGSGRSALWLGALAALSLLTRSETVVVSVAFFDVCVANARGRRVRNAALFAAPMAAAVGFVLWYNNYRFGSPLDFGYVGESFSTPALKGLYLLALSPGKGLIWFSPAAALFFFGFREMLRRDRRAAWLVLAFAVLPFAVYSRWSLPGGDLSWGPRYLLPTVMLMCLGAGLGARRLLAIRARGLGTAFIAALLGVSLVVQVLSVSVDFHRYTDVLFSELNPRRPTDDDGINIVYYNPAYSPISGNWQLVRYMLDNNYRTAFFDDRGDLHRKLYLHENSLPDFTLWRMSEDLRRKGGGKQ